MKKLLLLFIAAILLVGCSVSIPETEPTAVSTALTAVVETQAIPTTEETTQPTEPDLPWDPNARWYGTYYFEKNTNPDPNIVPGVVRFNCLLRNEGRETLTVASAHADFYQGTELVAQEDFDSNRLPAFFFHPGVGNLKMEYGESKVFQVYTKNVEKGIYDRVIVTFTIADPSGAEYSEKFHFAVNEEDITPYSTSDRTDWSPVTWTEERWDFYMYPRNNTDDVLKFVGTYDVVFRDGLPMSADFFGKSTVNREALGYIETLNPGEVVYYQTGITHRFNASDERETTMVYENETGERYLQTFRFALDEEHTVPGRTSIYRPLYEKYGIQFLDTPELLYQVLGQPQYTPEQIRQMIEENLSPEELAEKISTLQDAQQFFMEMDFPYSSGDVKQRTNGVLWHYNVTPEKVLQQRHAGCGSGSNLMSYLLRDDFDEAGYIHWSGVRTGHVFNYFRKDDKYYFFDWTEDFQECKAVMIADSLETFGNAFIEANHADYGENKDAHILIMYAYPCEGNQWPIGDGDKKTPKGVPLMCRIPAEIEDVVKILYVHEDYAPIFAEAPPVSQWPKDTW